MRYATNRTCSREIDFEVDNNNILTSCELKSFKESMKSLNPAVPIVPNWN